MHSGVWTGMWKVLPNAGGSWWSQSVQKENVSLRTGRIRVLSRDSSFFEPFGLTGWPTLSGNEHSSENPQRTTDICRKCYFKFSWRWLGLKHQLFWSLNIVFLYRNFIEDSLDSKYVDDSRMEFEKCFEECNPSTPVFFILSPGVNPVKDVETLGKHRFSLHLG